MHQSDYEKAAGKVSDLISRINEEISNYGDIYDVYFSHFWLMMSLS